MAALRIFSAGLIFIPFAFFHFSKIPRNKLGLVVLSAVFGNLLPAFLFAEAMARIDGSLGGILNSLTPICVVVVGIFLFKNKVETKKIIGVLVGFAGLVLLMLAPAITGDATISFRNISYSLLIILATILYGINVNMVGRYLKGISPIHAATVSLSFMTIPAGVILWQQGFLQIDFAKSVVQEAITYVVLLGVLGSAIATALFYMLVQKAGIIFASLVTYGIPFVALAWGFKDNEKITWLKIVCLGIILLGVYLANRQTKTAVK